ncbi:MAG TPA: dihydrolipoamide acetyltransferase family protein [Acidimicrobiia bacterium]|nr:dihydrolipoamide acetyltransferase family protein [Acidimicrobiia bacterium]
MGKIEFLLPDVGEGLDEGEIVSWLVAPGDTVSRDQPLVEVQTDKALVELPSPVAGQVVSLSFGPGDIVKVGQVLVVLDDGGSTPAPGTAPKNLPAGSAPDTPALGGPAPDTPAPAGPASEEPARSGVGRPKAAPAVRKLALDRGVDLASVRGTGPGGRILASDVEAAAHHDAAGAPDGGIGAVRSAVSSAATAGAGPDSPVRPPGTDRQLGWMETGRHPLRGIRRVTAEAMGRSWSEIPHLTTLDEVDATGLVAARRRLTEAGIEATIGALLVAAVARGLRRYPVMNASVEIAPPGAAPSDAGGRSGDPAPAVGPVGAIVVHAECHIGLAVATPDGLVVPVVRHADRRSLGDLAAEVRRLTEAARNRRVAVGDLRGGTFTISNYGSLGGRFATPLIRPPEVGVMGFGAIRPRPIVVDGKVEARPTLPWSLSADHRLIDGDVATAFAEYVTGLLADPVALFAELLATGTTGRPGR